MERPDGSQSTLAGWILVSIGLVAAFMAAAVENHFAFIVLFAVANLGVGLGVLLLALGYLVRAIWFLPGRDLNAAGHELLKCDYCDLKIAAPSEPCSAVPTLELANIASRIDSENCRRVLVKKGFLQG